MSKKIAKFSSFFIGFCFIACTLWYPSVNTEEAVTARTRQVEGVAANIATPEDSSQKLTELSSEDNPEAIEPTQAVLQEDSEVQPKTLPKVESQNVAAAESIKRTKPVEVNSPQKLLSEPSKETQEAPLKKSNVDDSSTENVALPESAFNHQHLEEDKRKPSKIDQPQESTHTADLPSEDGSENQILAENVEDLSATLEKKIDPQPNEEVEKSEAADKPEANAGGEKSEDFPSYTEWTKKVLAEEKNKQDDHGKASSNLPQKQKMRNNYASGECGAKIVLANPEAENTKFILNGNPDEYMINPCQAKKWFIVELCETIQIKNIETASLELFSSRPKSFRFSVSDRYPSKEWQELGTFDSTEERTVHKYQVAEDNYSKFIKVDVVDHYGEEHFCPLTLFRVFGFTIEDIDGEPTSSPSADDEDDDVENESPPNLFNSAKDTVLRLVKHVLTTTNEQVGKDGTKAAIAAPKEEHENATTKETDTAISPPNVTIPCKGEECRNITQKNTTANGTSLPCVPDARDQRPIETATPATTLPIRPEEPQGDINLMTNATIEYPDENLVTKLEDYEQVPVSSEEEPIVQLIGCDEQLPLFTAHTSACMYCSLRKKKTFVKETNFKPLTLMPRCLIRPSHTAKCKFLRIISDIFFKKQQGVSESPTSQEVPVSSIVTLIGASSTTASSSSSSWSVIKEVETAAIQAPESLETDASIATLSKSASDLILDNVPSLQPSSDFHPSASSETITGKKDESKVFDTLESSKEESETVSVTLKTSQEQKANLTTQFTDKLTSTLITSSQLASSVSSSSEDIDFRTPAGTIYIEPSSTSIKELQLQHAVSSERSPVDPLSHNLTPTSSVVPDSQDKQVIASSLKSDIKEEDSFPENNIITTASLPSADGEQMEPAAANIEPTRVSESPSKVIPPESLSVSIPVMRPDQKTAQLDKEMDAEPDSKGRPLYTLVRVGLPPAAKRESAIMRLNNRIKALELNVSLSSRFLDELSQRYRKQSEEMMNFLNRTVARLRNATKKTEETVQRHEVHLNILEARLDNLTQAVSKLSDNMDELTRHLTDRQMVWASIEMAILTLIFVVCLKKRQPSLPPSLVAKVLEDLLQTQNSSHSRRRNSDSEILQLTPNHREVVRQRSADDLACPKSVDIVEPEIPFLLGQTKEVHKKKKRKKNKSLDLKMGQVNGTSKSVLPAHRSVSTTQLNSAGLLFMGLPEDGSSPTDGGDLSTPSTSSCSKEPERTNRKSNGAGSCNITNCNIISSKSDPDLYSPYQPVVLPPPLVPPLRGSQDHLLYFNPSVMTTNSSTLSFPPSVTATTVALPTQIKSGPIHSGQAKSGPPPAAAASNTSSLPSKSGSHIKGCHYPAPLSTAMTVGSLSLHGNSQHGPLRQSASLPENKISMNSGGGGTSTKPVTISASSGPSAIRNRLKTLNVTQKNYSERKNVGRCTANQVQCSGFRKY